MAFERRFTGIEKLGAEPLFSSCLLPDILGGGPKGSVFPAVRKDMMDFYYMGGLLFSYNQRSGFTTHNKYASVIKSDPRKPYVNERNLQAIDSFAEGYERIKENCSLYSGVEAHGVSRIYGSFSCARSPRSHHVVVLDIEISLRHDSEGEKPEPGEAARAHSDRIDLLLFDIESGVLRFFEAKDFSNGEIRAAEGHAPRIVNQMSRYEKQLGKASVREEMLAGYANHVDVINRLFRPEPPLPAPGYIDPVPRLLCFGFDREQLTGKLRKEVDRLENEYGLYVYAIGDIKRADPHALFSGGKKRWHALRTP